MEFSVREWSLVWENGKWSYIFWHSISIVSFLPIFTVFCVSETVFWLLGTVFRVSWIVFVSDHFKVKRWDRRRGRRVVVIINYLYFDFNAWILLYWSSSCCSPCMSGCSSCGCCDGFRRSCCGFGAVAAVTVAFVLPVAADLGVAASSRFLLYP